MKELPVVNIRELERRELFERINLSSRPSINFTLTDMDRVASKLASSDFDRKQFVNNPAGYLENHELMAPSCGLVEGTPTHMSEICSAVAICNAAVVVNAAAFTKAAVYLGVLAVQIAAAVNTVATYNYTYNYTYTSSSGFVPEEPAISQNNGMGFEYNGGVL